MAPSPLLARLRNGAAVVLALALGCSGSDLLLPSASAPAAITVASGNSQSGVAGGILPESLAVRITDAAGRPAAQIRVAFTAGAGRTQPDTSLTDSTGHAASQWTLGAQPGTYTAKANVVGSTQLSASFTATAVATSASTLSITTQPSPSAVLGQPLAQQPQIQLRDNQGNAVAQAGIAVTAAIASGPTGGTLSGQLTQATNAGGLATFTDLSLSGATGTYTLGFSGANLAGVTSAQISVNSGAPSASRSSLTAAPKTIALGASSTVTVTVRDPLGNPMGGINVVPAADDPSGAFTPQQATTDANGVVAFSFAGTQVRTYTISAKAAGVMIEQTASVQVTKVQTSTAITSDDPDPSLLGQPFPVAFTVTAATGTPTGTVTVSDGQVSCSAAVGAGGCQLTPLTPGLRTLTAQYAGTDVFAASSGTATHDVLAPTATQLSSSLNPALQGQTVTFTSQVTSTFRTVNSGAVMFGDGGTCPSPADTLGTRSVNSNGVATLSKKNLTVGTHIIVACYQGTTTFAPSGSDPLIQQITNNK